MAKTYNSRERPSFALARLCVFGLSLITENEGWMVELTGIEPVASSMPLMRSPS